MDLDLDHFAFAELQFLEDIANRRQHRASFGRDIPEHLDTRREVSCHQPGKEGVLVIQYHLAKGRVRFGNRPRLYTS